MSIDIEKLFSRNDEDGQPPVVIAEIGANHDGDPDKAKSMLDAIAKTGAQLVKFQLYSADDLVADKNLEVTWGPSGNKRTESVGAMFSRIALPAEAFKSLFQYARNLGLIPFATPFSEEGVNLLMDLNNPIFKIASSDVSHVHLLRHIAKTGKPVILSLGKSTLAEVDQAVSCLKDSSCKYLALLHCVASYPSPMNEMNLRTITLLKQIYSHCVVGFSDHSLGISAPLAAVALGAKIIEKHVTLDKNADGPDHWFSINMHQLKELVDGVRDVHAALGESSKRVLSCEQTGRKVATRSLFACRDLSAGHKISAEDIKIVRPGTGLRPDMLNAVEGMLLARSVKRNEPLTWDLFKPIDSI